MATLTFTGRDRYTTLRGTTIILSMGVASELIRDPLAVRVQMNGIARMGRVASRSVNAARQGRSVAGFRAPGGRFANRGGS